MRFYLLLFFLVFLIKVNAYASTREVLQTVGTLSYGLDSTHTRGLWTPLNKDSLFYLEDVEKTREKHFWRAGTEWVLIQAVPATFNRFIRKDPYSYITFKNFFSHLKLSAWKWDDNQFSTNQVDHPYHGQLYFNSFRSNGYNFYQSSLAAVAGSFIWETAGETQAPAINDFINTSFGGIILGEMTHRVSRNILARNRSGYNRVGNEIVALLVNPLNGLNRFLDGKWGKPVDKYYTTDSSHIHAVFDLGFRRFDAQDGEILQTGRNSLFGRLRFFYTNGDHNYKRPFDKFSVNLEVGNGDSTFINAINVHALLTGAEFFKSKRGRHFGTLDAHYDTYNNDAFFYGAQSVVYNWNSDYLYKNGNKLNLSFGAGAVLLAAVPDPYLLFGDSRNYNYGSGLSYRFKGEVNLYRRLRLSADYNGGYFHTISGNESYYFLHAAAVEANVRIIKRFSLNLSSGYFTLESHYKDPKFADFTKKYPYGRASIAYNILF